ncbi:peptidoglycan recognition protein-like [Danaus plexippus]|uniref:peptidoglycan recognition protein-like n=1 Tax=Danaus plexippus TaxID=13037 RepID=UPI002AB167AC|nr:peptidoglycan recognition protein-like [Danaus plexippus]
MLFLWVFAATLSLVSSDCNVVPIEEWSGSNSNRVEKLPKPVNLVIIQHTVTTQCFTDTDCNKIINVIRNYHLNNRGFTDIAMSFLVGGNGKIYEGAGWHVGSHTRGYNNRSISLSFIGDFRTKLPSNEALQAAIDFLDCAFYKNYLTMDYSLVGTQQLIPTLSPGEKLQSLIKTWPHWKEDVSQL